MDIVRVKLTNKINEMVATIDDKKALWYILGIVEDITKDVKTDHGMDNGTFEEPRKRVYSSIDTSKAGIEYAGIKLSEKEFSDICTLNQLSTEPDRQNIPMFNAMLLLKVLGLLPESKLTGTEVDESNHDEYLKRMFGRTKKERDEELKKQY